jgi:hypothetical protein
MSEQPQALKLQVVTTSPSSLRTGSGEQVRKLVEQGIAVETLNKNFARFMTGLESMLAVEPTAAGSFELEEITFTAEISVDGEFKLLGSGVGTTATGGISFTLRRQKTNSS